MVYDIDKDKVIFDHNSHKHFTPASNTKLLTYFAALKMMPDSVPAIKYCFVDDTFFFTGTGDPTLLYPNFEYGKTMDFLASQEDQLVYIPRPIEDERFGPGWSWDDYPYYYSAEKSSFPIYGNMVYLERSAKSDYIKVTPDYFEKNLFVIHDNTVDNSSLNREEFTNNYVLRFNKMLTEMREEMPFIYSDSLFIELLSDTLNRNMEIAHAFPNCSMQTLYSVPSDSIAKHILIESDNYLAEQMLLLISEQLSDTLSSEKVLTSMMDSYFSEMEEEIRWVDGSGLSRYNQVTPNAMVKLLSMIYEEVPRDKLYQMLPESNLSGTLKNSFTNLRGSIHAKTGSMSHVYCLSGFLETKSGKTLLFSFMNNNFNASFSELKHEMEKVLSVFVND